jgi:hypothetical protein
MNSKTYLNLNWKSRRKRIEKEKKKLEHRLEPISYPGGPKFIPAPCTRDPTIASAIWHCLVGPPGHSLPLTRNQLTASPPLPLARPLTSGPLNWSPSSTALSLWPVGPSTEQLLPVDTARLGRNVTNQSAGASRRFP